MARPFGEGDWVQHGDGIPKGELTSVVTRPVFEVLEIRQGLAPPHGRIEWHARLRVVQGVHRMVASGDHDESRWEQVTSGEVMLYDLVESVEARMARELMG